MARSVPMGKPLLGGRGGEFKKRMQFWLFLSCHLSASCMQRRWRWRNNILIHIERVLLFYRTDGPWSRWLSEKSPKMTETAEKKPEGTPETKVRWTECMCINNIHCSTPFRLQYRTLSNRTMKWKHYYDVFYVLENKLAICLFLGYFDKDYKKFQKKVQYFDLFNDLLQYLFDNIYFSKKVKVGRIRIRPVP